MLIKINRREFVKGLGFGVGAVAWGGVPGLFNNAAQAQSQIDQPKLIMVLFDGGADSMDYLHYDIPEAQNRRANIQSSTARPSGSMITIGHPYVKLSSNFQSLYNARSADMAMFSSVAINQQSGSHDTARSVNATGVPSSSGINSGWLGRCVEEIAKTVPSPFLAWGFSQNDSANLAAQSYKAIIANPNLATYSFRADTVPGMNNTASTNESLYRDWVLKQNTQNQALNASFVGTNIKTTNEALQNSIAQVRQINQQFGTRTVTYPNNSLGNQLRAVATLIAGGLLRVACVRASGGHDTHSNQVTNNNNSQAANRDAIAAFLQDMENIGQYNNIVLCTDSDFGRQVAQNSTDGTDHGWGKFMFAFGGRVVGGLHGGVATPAQISSMYGLPRPQEGGTHSWSVYYRLAQHLFNGQVPSTIFPEAWTDTPVNFLA